MQNLGVRARPVHSAHSGNRGVAIWLPCGEREGLDPEPGLRGGADPEVA